MMTRGAPGKKPNLITLLTDKDDILLDQRWYMMWERETSLLVPSGRATEASIPWQSLIKLVKLVSCLGLDTLISIKHLRTNLVPWMPKAVYYAYDLSHLFNDDIQSHKNIPWPWF